jgi:hypothetical protein
MEADVVEFDDDRDRSVDAAGDAIATSASAPACS